MKKITAGASYTIPLKRSARATVGGTEAFRLGIGIFREIAVETARFDFFKGRDPWEITPPKD